MKYTIALAGAANMAITIGATLCMGLFTDIFAREFKISNAQVSLVVSLAVSILFGASSLTLPLVGILGCRRGLILCTLLSCICFILASYQRHYLIFVAILGPLLGFLFNLIYTCSILVVPQQFQDAKSRQTANALINVGSGMGGLLFPLFYETLLRYYAWRQVLFITGAFVLHLIPIAMLFPEKLRVDLHKEKQQQKRKKEQSLLDEAIIEDKNEAKNEDKNEAKNEDKNGLEKSKTNVKLLMISKSGTFWSLGLCYLLTQGCTSAFHTFVVPLMRQHGFGPNSAAAVIVILQGCSIPGRLSPTVTRDILKCHTLYQYCLAASIFGMAATVISLLGNIWPLTVICAVIFGLNLGFIWAIFPTVMSDLYMDNQLHAAFAFASACFGLGGFFMPIFVGTLVDFSQSYAMALAAVSLSMALWTIFTALLRHERNILP